MKRLSCILLVLLSLLDVKPDNEFSANSIIQSVAKVSAESFSKFLETGDTLNLSGVLSDSFLQNFSIQNLVEERKNAIQNWGDLKNIENFKFTSENEALVQISIGNKELELYLEFDEKGRINELQLIDQSREDLKPKVSWEELGDDTLIISPINQLEQLRSVFKKDKRKVRLVSLLSPT